MGLAVICVRKLFILAEINSKIMKRKITLLLLGATSVLAVKSQVLINEGFTNPFNPTTAGWIVSNQSLPLGTTTWTQGTTNYNSYNGGPTDYYFANFNSASATAPAGISNWFITPAVTIYNGAVIEFATKTINQGAGQPNFSPDRLQLRMSQTGVTAIPAGTTNVGSFTDLLLDINPNLNTSTVSAVNNGSVNGYPNAWTVYSVQISGVTGTVTGRFAFRYFVDDGGLGGANSNNIGLDAVKYTLPCLPTVQSFTTCANAATTLQAVGLPATTYSWSTGATTSSIVVSPATTTTYTLFPSNGAAVCGTSVTAAITVSSNLAISVSASSNTVCAGSTVTLTATGPASSYAWTSGSTVLGSTPSITVAPTANTTYSVGGLNASCTGGNSISITTLARPTVSITSASTLLCVSGPSVPVSFTGNGASTYIWVLGSSSATGSSVTVNIAAQTATTPAVQNVTLGLIGTGTNGCSAADIFTLVVAKNPSVTAAITKTFVCINQTVTVSANGANTYAWTGASTSTNSSFTYSSNAAGLKTFSVAGTSTTGCTANALVTVSVSTCTGIEKVNGNGIEASVFPNPFANELTLSGIEGTVEIYNALGQIVIRTVTADTETINTTELPKGAYILKAYNKEGESVKTIKLLKN